MADKKSTLLSKRMKLTSTDKNYKNLLSGISNLLEEARRVSARSINTILTATYWEIGRRIVEFEQKGKEHASYGKQTWQRIYNCVLAEDSQNAICAICANSTYIGQNSLG